MVGMKDGDHQQDLKQDHGVWSRRQDMSKQVTNVFCSLRAKRTQKRRSLQRRSNTPTKCAEKLKAMNTQAKLDPQVHEVHV